jgi:hypothetical protein
MAASQQGIEVSLSTPQGIEQGHGQKQLPEVVVNTLEPIVTDLVMKILSNPAIWPSAPSPTPVGSFGPSIPPLNADKLGEQLAKATEKEDALGLFETLEIRFEPGTGRTQDNLQLNSSSIPAEPVSMNQSKEPPEAVLEHELQSSVWSSNGMSSVPAENDHDERQVQASRPEFKTVREMYDSCFDSWSVRVTNRI